MQEPPLKFRIIGKPKQIESAKEVLFKNFFVVDASPSKPDDNNEGCVRCYVMAYLRETPP